MPSRLTERLRADAEIGAARAMAAQDLDAYSDNAGCFDRRFWAWKMVDYPEATFQRLVYPLALLHADPASRYAGSERLVEAICRGLRFSAKVQHPNGSFDQAFPNEQSWAATAFMLHPLVESFNRHRTALGADADAVEKCLRRAAVFVRDRAEQHGVITNHLAGGALGLFCGGAFFGDTTLTARAGDLLDHVLRSQSSEGWFPEYAGADPGYQTLGLYYLAEIRRYAPSVRLDDAILKSLEFVQWFVHPDGSFGGVYGSRRTAIAYLGAFALLAEDFPVAAAMFHALAPRIAEGRALSAATVDDGNLAPVLTSLVIAAQCDVADGSAASLPAWSGRSVMFPDAGLYVMASDARYVIVGASNGGTVTAFDRTDGRRLIEDGGYVGLTTSGQWLTTQSTGAHRVVAADRGSVSIETRFVSMLRLAVTAWRFVALRLLNLTVMRDVAFGNRVKRLLVRRLITGQRAAAVTLIRHVAVSDGAVSIDDELRSPRSIRFKWLECGRSFNAIHMASAGYRHPDDGHAGAADTFQADVARLAADGVAAVRFRL